MSVRDCLKAKVEAGRITNGQATEILAMLDDFERQNLRTMSPQQAEAVAAADVGRTLDRMALRQKRLANMQIMKTAQVTANMRRHPKGLETGAISHLARDVADFAPWPNVDMQTRALRAEYHALWASGLARLKPRGGLLRRVKTERNVGRELFGESTGDETAAAIARAWANAAETARLRFNAHGGAIPKREDWGFPHNWDERAVRKVTKDQWINDVWPELDREKMIDFDSGRPLSDARLADLLDQTYERIRTGGLIDMTPGNPARRKLANRHLDHRFLVFKNHDAWERVNQKYGVGNLFETLVKHLDVMSRDTAHLQVLGPNPDAMVRYMEDFARREAALAGRKPSGVKLRLFRDTYAVTTGRSNVPVSEGLAMVSEGTRNSLISGILGGAFISAVGDLNFGEMARAFSGLPATGMLRSYLQLISPLTRANQELAVHLELGADNWTSMALAGQRILGEFQGPRITQLMADATLRATFLSPFTQAGRWAIGWDWLGFLGRSTDQTFDQLPKRMQRALGRYGIGEADWNVIRRAPVVEKQGTAGTARFVSPRDVASQPGGLEAATKLRNLLQSEQEFAVPSQDARTRAILTQGTQRGSIIGEAARSVALFKGFPTSVLMTHVMRGVSQNTTMRRGAYLGALLIGSAVFGAAAYQMKQMQRGKDPISMNPESEAGRRFWMAALWQGGGLGIFGDFMFSDVNRFGRGPAMTLAGPVADLFDNVMRLTAGNVQELAIGEDTRAGREIVDFIGRYLPGGSIWYARLAFERLVLDQAREAADPDARDRFRRMESRARREFGQRYFWRPGRLEPSRPPNLGAMLEGG